MYISSIKAQGFRNLSSIEFKPNHGLNIFIGKNGQGKTNLLETVYVASKGKSFRPGKINEWRSLNLPKEDYSSLDFQISDDKLNHNLKIIWNNETKQILLDDKKVTTGKLVQILPTILFSPESLLAIKEGPDKRRILIDEIISSTFETQHFFSQYKKSLKSRNKFLKICKETGKFEENLYRSMNILFLNFSTQLSLARIEYLINLDSYIKKALTLIFNNELNYRFEYIISENSVKDWDAKDILALHQKRAADLKISETKFGSSLVGAHKHDIKFYLNDEDSRFFSSQGQQRGLILAIKMAEVMYRYKKGERPILLLDDVLSELDTEKQEKLIDFLKDFETQIFVTTTELIKQDKLHGHFYNIEKGQIKLNQIRS